MRFSLSDVRIVFNGACVARRCQDAGQSLRIFTHSACAIVLQSPVKILAAACTALLALSCQTGVGETLDQAWAIAVAQNHRLAAAQLEEVAAASDVEAASAERLPTIGLRSGYIVRSEEPSFLVRDPLPGMGTFQFPYAQQNAASAGIEARLPVYTGGRITNSVLCAEARQQVARHEADKARLDLLMAVGQAYLAVLRAQRTVEVVEHERQSLEAHAQDVERLHRQNRVAQNDLLTAQVAASNANVRYSQANRELEVVRARYNQLLGRPLTTTVVLEEATIASLEMSLDEIVATAHQRRPDLLALLAESDSHEFASSSARGTSRPQVTATMGTQYDENRYGDPQSLATAAVTIDWKLFDGGKARSAATAEQLRASSIRRLVEDRREQIAFEIFDAWNQVADASGQLEIARQSLIQTTENLRVARLRFASGMTTNTAVLQAQATYSQSMHAFHYAHYEGVAAQLRLRYLAALL